MKLVIEGVTVEIADGQTIYDGVLKAGLETDKLATRPLAAQIGGDVFSLRYVPYKDAEVKLLRYRDDMGMRVYEYSSQFILLLAARKLFPGAKLKVCYKLDCGVYITVDKEPALSRADVRALEFECNRLAMLNLPLERKRLDIKDALEYFEHDGQPDKAELLQWRKFSYFDVYSVEGYMDYFYGEMVPSTSYIKDIRLKLLTGAMIMLMPRPDKPDEVLEYHHQPKLAEVFKRADEWNGLMHCDSAAELNKMVKNGRIRELIRINEALHERTYAQIADDIVHRKVRAVMVAGPSSSGKTTSANRLSTQLRVLGQDPIMISLDDYYIDRDKIEPDENGEIDLEHIETLDIPRFNSDLAALLRGEQAEVPRFSFQTGKRMDEGFLLKLHADQPLIIEGIHGLNNRMISSDIPEDAIYRIYVSALTTLNLDDHNRIRTTDVRLLRRLVRDYETRGASMEHTLAMWDSVRRGEQTWIFPYQEQADAIFNTALVYELAVLKKYVYPLLLEVKRKSPYYMKARSIVKFLNYFVDADVEDEIPPTSILREFIGGNTFYR